METTVKTRDGRDNADSPSGTPGPEAGLQPFLHDAVVSLAAPGMAVSRPDGQVGEGADGFYLGDRRALSLLHVAAEDVPNAPIGGGPSDAAHAAFRTVLRGLAEHSPDPAVTLERRRAVEPGELTERLVLHNAGRTAVTVRLTVRAASDLASIESVKSGHATGRRAPGLESDGPVWTDGELTARLTCDPAPESVEAGPHRTAVLRHTVELGPGERWSATVCCAVDDPRGVAFRPATAEARAGFAADARLASADRGLDHWFARTRSDLAALLMADPLDERDTFLAAGAPWFLTLFGRDSLWAARMLLPLGTDLAAGTLRTLARRQGGANDPETGEQPGKILHEVRRDGLHFGDGSREGAPEGLVVPPCYYGTIDATPLWITLLHDAWRWGMPEHQVADLLPHAESALAWLDGHGDADGDGFLEYIDHTGRGLANQGWKDSGDAVRTRDGRLAEPPVALCEVQAYAHEAAVCGAELLRAFGRPGADRWTEWADGMRRRFREHFWVEDARGPYPAIALGGDKRPLDALTSNIGHLLGTGLLDAEESRLVADRLTGEDLDSGFGLRTLAEGSGGFSPLGYHIGTVWPHDTAIVVQGLARDGHFTAAAALAEGLIRAADAFDGRLPELFAGHGAAVDPRPAPYPASCRPQAWSAAASVAVLQALLGLEADAPGGRLTVRPRAAEGRLPVRAGGLRLGGREFEVAVAADGTPTVTGLPDGWVSA